MCDESRKEKGYSARKKHRLTSLVDWQKSWENSEKGRWTHRLIPSIQEWIGRPHGEINFHMTQFLSGHGGFREYLHKIRRASSPNCPVCAQTVETPEHLLFYCPRFVGLRVELNRIKPGFRVENLVEYMCKDEDFWKAVSHTISMIVIELQEQWRKEYT